MNDHLSPPDVPFDPAARARIRQQVLTGLEETSSTHRRWLVPAAAVAAVAAIAVISAVVTTGGDDRSDLTPAGPGPATSTGTTDRPADEPSPTPTTATTSGPDDEALVAFENACRPELTARQADQVLTFSDDVGSVAFYSTGSRWQLCTVHADIVTVQADETLSRPPGPDSVDPYRVSTDTAQLADGSLQTSFTAGGVLYGDPADYESIVYTFAGGDTVAAEWGEGSDGTTYWVMDHVPTDGPLLDPALNQVELPRIQVEVTYADGLTQGFDLEWALDTCAQINHGC